MARQVQRKAHNMGGGRRLLYPPRDRLRRLDLCGYAQPAGFAVAGRSVETVGCIGWIASAFSIARYKTRPY